MDEQEKNHSSEDICYEPITDEEGKPTGLLITSPKSASLPPSELVQEISIYNTEFGIFIEYAPGSRTEEAVEQLLQWLREKNVPPETYSAGYSRKGSALLAPHQMPAGRRYINPNPYLFGFMGRHFTEEYPKEVHIRNVSLDEATAIMLKHLAKTDIPGVKSVLPVKEVKVYFQLKHLKQAMEELSKISTEKHPELPLLRLHLELEKVKAYEKIKKPKHREVLEEYLLTNKPMGDLKDIAGVKTADGVNHIIHRNLQKIFPDLPPEVQAQYGGSANEAIKRKADTQLQTDISKRRIKEGLATKRWQHYREVDKPQGKPAFSEQGVENIKRRGRNIPREDMSNIAHRRWEKYRERHTPSTPARAAHEIQQNLTSKEHTIIDFTKPSQEP